jgi:hypothetical protein
LEFAEENTMKATLIAMAALSLLTVAMPASAQDYGWRDRDHNWRDHDWDRRHRSGITVDIGRAYARDRDCAVRITKVQRPNGTVVTRRVRSCD